MTADHKPLNRGHGHVFLRPDGVRARCGGPGLCRDCSRDKVVADQKRDPETVARWFHEAMRDRLRDLGVVGTPLRDASNAVVAVTLHDADVELTSKWYLTAGGYAASTSGYLHRRLADAPDDKAVDHRNGDRLDNRRSNLRLVSTAENGQNRISPNDGTRGVSWHAKAGKWRAYGTIAGKQQHLGLFVDHAEAEEAARAWRVENMAATVEDRASDWPQEYLRHAAAMPWSQVPEANRKLMVATVTEVLAKIADPRKATPDA